MTLIVTVASIVTVPAVIFLLLAITMPNSSRSITGLKSKLLQWLPGRPPPTEAMARHIARAFAGGNTSHQLDALLNRVLEDHIGVKRYALYLASDFVGKPGQAFYRIDLAHDDSLVTDTVLPAFPKGMMLSILRGTGRYDIKMPTLVPTSAASCLSVSAAIPILYQGRTIGVWILGRHGRDSYSAENQQLLRLTGHCLGPALMKLITCRTAALNRHYQLRHEQLTCDIQRMLHDLKNPIGSILGMVEIYNLPRQEATAIEEAASDALHGLNQTLAVLNGQKKHQAPLRLNTIVRKVAARFTLSPINLQLNDLPDLYGNEGEIKSLLDNLLKNAIEAEGIKGWEQTIAVATRYEADSRQVVCQVSDQGCGIPADVLPKLWSGHTTKPHGSGIGLPIAKRIVDQYDGSITVNSIPGQGTTVTFSLPVKGVSPAISYKCGSTAQLEKVDL